jgi:hypothetical protein
MVSAIIRWAAARLTRAPHILTEQINISYVNNTALLPIQDSTQEFRVATNNVSPEFGRFAGGVLNMSTKSGTNQLHGGLYETHSEYGFQRQHVLPEQSRDAARPRSPKTSTA